MMQQLAYKAQLSQKRLLNFSSNPLLLHIALQTDMHGIVNHS
jgi:hypothetical protein